MPTASPSIRASDGVIVLRSANAVKAMAPAGPRRRRAGRRAAGSPAATRLPSDDDEHDEGDGQAEHLAGADERGVLGDLDAVVGGEAGGGQGGVAARGDEGTVVDRDGLGVVVELHLDDRVPAVLAHEAGGRGGAGDGLAVLVLRAACGQVGLALRQLGPALSTSARPDSICSRRAGMAGSSGFAASSWSSSASPPASWPSASASSARPASSSRLAVLELGGGGGEVGGALVELVLRLERVVDALDVRHLGPGGEDVLGGRLLFVGDGRRRCSRAPRCRRHRPPRGSPRRAGR